MKQNPPNVDSTSPTTEQPFQSLRYELKAGVAHIILDRPQVYNSFNKALSDELLKAIKLAEADHLVRAVMISGSGKAFSAGQDLAELQGPDAPTVADILDQRLTPLVESIQKSRLPFLAAVNGVAAGAGANLAFCCDLVVASAEATFIQAFINVGLIPDTAGTFFLPRLIGLSRAKALCFLGDRLSAAEAKEIGLVFRVFPVEEFQSEAFALAKRLAKQPPQAIALGKAALNRSLNSELSEQLALEAQYQKILAGTDDHREGVRAFLEKRAPEFKGE